MAITLIVNHGEGLGSTGGTTTGIDTSGCDFLVLTVVLLQNNPWTLSDSKSNTWTPLTIFGTVNECCQLFYATNPTVGSGHTFTASAGGAAVYPAICIAGFSGVNTTSPFDSGTDNGAEANATDVTNPTITPSSGERLIISDFGIGGTTSASVDSGLTITDTVAFSSGNNFGASLAYKVQATGTAIGPKWSNSTSTFLATSIAAFKGAPPVPQETRPIPPVSDLSIAHWTAHLSRARYYSEPIKRFEGHTPQPTYIFPLQPPPLRHYEELQRTRRFFIPPSQTITQITTPTIHGTGTGLFNWKGTGYGTTLATTSRTHVFINGVDRSAWVGLPIRREAEVGARVTCTFSLNDAQQAFFSFAKFQEVVVYCGSYRFFGGIIEQYEETTYMGTHAGDVHQYTVKCIDFGALLDRRYIATHYEIGTGGLINIIMYDIVSKYLADLGITWGGSGGVTGPLINPITFNWVTAAEVCRILCTQANLDFAVDAYKVLQFMPKSGGTLTAPFSITDGNRKWINFAISRDSTYWNYVIVRNSQDFWAIWTDTYTGNGTQVIFPTRYALKQKPEVFVNGIRQTVTDVGAYSHPYDWIWSQTSIYQNPTHAALTGGDTLEIKYQSDISQVAIAQDTAEIAAHGRYDHLLDIKDIVDRTTLQAIADGELAKGLQTVVSVNLETNQIGIEPGQLLTVNTTWPVLNTTILVDSMSSELIGAGNAYDDLSGNYQEFRHSIRGSNAQLERRTSGTQLFQQLLQSANQPRDRVQYEIGWTLAETIPGLTNPGLQAGIETVQRTAKSDGVALVCRLQFKNTQQLSGITISSTNSLQITNSSMPFTSANVNDVVNITGGTGFNVGSFQIASVTGNIATLSASAGVLGSTGGTGTITLLTTTDCIIDIRRNGTSIFAGGAGMTWPAGATTVQTTFIFASDPYDIKTNDIFTAYVIQADSKARDGAIELTVIG